MIYYRNVRGSHKNIGEPHAARVLRTPRLHHLALLRFTVYSATVNPSFHFVRLLGSLWGPYLHRKTQHGLRWNHLLQCSNSAAKTRKVAKRETGNKIPCILNLDKRWRRVVSFTLRLLYSRKISDCVYGWADATAGLYVTAYRKIPAHDGNPFASLFTDWTSPTRFQNCFYLIILRLLVSLAPLVARRPLVSPHKYSTCATRRNPVPLKRLKRWYQGRAQKLIF